MTEPIDARPLLSLMLAHQRRGWRRGERAPVETYLERQPGLQADPDAVLDLIYNEIVLRAEVGESPRLEEYQDRFPHLAEPLRLQFELERVFGPESPTGPDGSGTVQEGFRPPPTPAVRPDIPGYEILGELGRGGMGVVYRARLLRLNRVVALKMILAGDHAAPEAAIRFLGEAESVARLHHPNVVQVHAFGDHDGNPYFEMEYVAGGNLADRLDGTPWPARDAARLIETLARAIHEVHRLGIVHRDLKPANVLLATDGTPKIADFGLAKWLDVETGLTRTDHILGSPSYMAPEQAGGGSEPVGPAADVYALGAILYELLTGRPPFRAATALETLEQVKSAEPVAPARLRPGLPRDLETICLRCLRKEAARRYDSAAELGEDLRRFGAGEPIRARPVGALERAWRWCRREPVRAGLAAGLALSLLGGLAGVAAQWRRAEENVHRQREANRRARERFDAAMKAIRASVDLAYGATLRREAHLDGLRRELLQTALGSYRELQESLEADASLEARSQLYAAYSRVGNIAKEFGLYAEALAAHRRALALVEQMASAAPADPAIRANRAQCLEWIGGILNLAGRPTDALRSFEQAREILEPLARDAPADLRRQDELSWLLADIAVAQERLGRRAEATRLHEQVLGIRQALVDRDPGNLHYRSDLAWCWRELGLAREAAGDMDAAPRLAERAVSLLRDVVRADPGPVVHRQRLAACLCIVGRLRLRSRRPAEAADPLEQASEYLEALARDDPSQFRDDLAHSLLYLASQRMRTDRSGEALTSIRRAEELLDQSPAVSRWNLYNLACAYSLFSATAGNGAAQAPAARGMAALRRAVAAGYDNLGQMGRDPDLDPLRSRHDFQMLMMDLAFPTDPFPR